ncbi:MAG: hypothetical protein NVS9B1_15350 [Candidatus Dormibacteraceae bacterium]
MLLVLILVVYPLGVLIASAGAAGRAGLQGALDTGLLSAALNTLWTGVLVTVLSVGAGLAAAMVTERTAVRRRALLRLAMLAPLAIPPFVTALGWTEAYGPTGILSRLFGFSLPGVYGPAGVVAVLAVEGVPLAYAVIAAGLSARSEPDLERAARAAGATAVTAFTTITLRLQRPALAAAGVLVFVTSANSFGVPQVLGVPAGFSTLTTRIYQQLMFSAEPAAFSAALVLALVLLAIPLAVAGLGDAFLAGTDVIRPGGGGGAAPGARHRRRVPALTLLAFVASTTAIPLLALVLTALTRAPGLPPTPSNWTLDNFRQSFGGIAGAGLGHSLGLALLSASAVLLMGGLVVALGRRGIMRPVGTAITATYALAGSGLALAILLAYGPLLRYSLALILIAYLAKFWALGHRPIAGSADRLPPEFLRAARAAGATPLTGLRTVVIPLLRPALAASWLLVFLAALHELTISSLLYGPGSETLAAAVLNLQELGDVTITAALAVVLTGLVLAAGGLLLLVRRLTPVRRWN